MRGGPAIPCGKRAVLWREPYEIFWLVAAELW